MDHSLNRLSASQMLHWKSPLDCAAPEPNQGTKKIPTMPTSQPSLPSVHGYQVETPWCLGNPKP